tara:strand:+ start:406 stop:807 length:402 start_codon:yes stop_codon:yes gene_type:complete
MIFYMSTRYEGFNGEPDLEVIDSIPSNNNTQEPVHAKLSDLMQWHIDDPVDDWERNRNNIIYYQFQTNRNPFIDNPEYAQLIWGYVGLNELEAEQKELMRIIDYLGREVEPTVNTPLIYVYSDGSVKKVIIVE